MRHVLALFFAVRSLAMLPPVVMIANGEPHVDRNFSLAYLFVLPPLFLLGSRWGIAGVAATWLIAYPVLFGFMGQRWVLRRLGIPVREFFGEIWPALASVSVMAIAVALEAKLLDGRGPAFFRLVVLSLTGAVVYVGMLYGLFRPIVESALGILRSRRAVPPT